MGVTVYIFDANRRIRRVLPDVTELLHTESDGTLEAVFPQTAGATPGEELGVFLRGRPVPAVHR